jgi:Na+-transporting methylmalonyl-CoA/oxaloacetate decarboxylase gamma subunit
MDKIVLSFQMYALAIVISFLVAALVRVLVNTLSRMQKKPEAPTAKSAPKPVVADDPDEEVAAIAAAVYALLGARRIVRIEPADVGRGWVGGGRMAHHASHAVPRKPR